MAIMMMRTMLLTMFLIVGTATMATTRMMLEDAQGGFRW